MESFYGRIKRVNRFCINEINSSILSEKIERIETDP